MTDDRLIRELQRLDPADRSELERAAAGEEAARLLGRILATDPAAKGEAGVAPGRGRDAAGGRDGRMRRPAIPRLRLAGAGVAAAAAVAAVLLLLIGSSTGGDAGDGSGSPLAGAIDRAATVAAAQPQVGVGRPWSYTKTRELAIRTTASGRRSWHVAQVTTREEWMAPDGPGRMRIVAGPSRFLGAGDRAEWEGAGRPGFLALGFGPRTEVHWIAGTVMRERVLDLPTEPRALATRLRHEAQAEQGELPLPAATLQLIAEDLRSPAASPRLRRALYEAVELVPGVRYFGARARVGHSTGTAVGVSGLGPDGKAQFALVFDPRTARPLGTREILPTGAGAGPMIQRSTVFVEAPAVAPPTLYQAASTKGSV
jgi:hypothetical protein